MKIRLKITTPAGQTSLFEHLGPVVRIGRDPSCELKLEGDDAGKAASRLHARIEMAAEAARLLDTGSANKTLHNNSPIDQPVTLRASDRIQIGYTGSTLTVVDLDLTPPRAALPRRPEPGVLLSAGVVALCLVLLSGLLLWRLQPTAKAEKVPTPRPAPSIVPPVIVRQPEKPARKQQKPVKEPEKPTRQPPTTVRALPSIEVKVVGHYLRLDTARPSVLVQRGGESEPWTVLRSGQAVSTAHSLVSLPGYESLVSLAGGLRLNLWGSLPEFGEPVQESAIMFNNPAPGVAVDLTLERGRVEIDGSRAAAGTRVRLRFLRQVWDVNLRERGSRVCAELWQDDEVSANGEANRSFGLFTRGKVRIRVGREELAFAGPARAFWSSSEPERVDHEELEKPPAWWGGQRIPATPQAKDALLSLQDWAVKRLDKAPDVIETMVTVARDSSDLTDRLIGLWFLAALGEASHLIEFLEDKDPKNADIRTTAMFALRDWLTRHRQRRAALVRLVQQRRGYARVNAELIVSLLLPCTAAACEKASTYQALIGYLNHDNPAVRALAFHHLYSELGDRMPREALEIEYDPTDGPEKRQEAVEKWRKMIPAGKVPVAPAKESEPDDGETEPAPMG
jgi:hypothetical protein